MSFSKRIFRIDDKKSPLRFAIKSVLANERGDIRTRPVAIGIIILLLLLGLGSSVLMISEPWDSDERNSESDSASSSLQSKPFLEVKAPSKPKEITEDSCSDSDEMNMKNCWPSPTSPTPSEDITKKNGGEDKHPSPVNVPEEEESTTPIIRAPIEETSAGETSSMPVESAPVAPVEPAPVTPVEPAPVTPVEPAPVTPVEPTPIEDNALTTFTYKCDNSMTGAIPLKGNVNGIEKWSDGITFTYEHADSTTNLRTLEAGVEYQVTFDGTYNQLGNIEQLWEDTSLVSCLRSLDHWGSKSGVVSAEYAFAHASNLVSVPAQLPQTVTSLSTAFLGAEVFNSPNISSWDTSNVTDMNSLFMGAISFNQSLENWDVSNVTNMYGMFGMAQSFDQPLGNWDVSKVTMMNYMFRGATGFNQPLGNWNVSKVTTMVSLFENATNFNQSLENWDVSKVQRMAFLFSGASNFDQPLDNWNVSSVVSMYSMFQNASKFNQPLNNWDVSNASKDMEGLSYMFSGASSFNQPLDSWDMSNATILRGMFLNASSFNQPLNSWDVSSVTNMDSMFSGASSFNQPLDSWDVSRVIWMDAIFADANMFLQDISMWDTVGVWSAQSFAPASFPDEYLPVKAVKVQA